MSLETEVVYYADSALAALVAAMDSCEVAENEPLPWRAHKAVITLRNKIQEYERAICGGCEQCPKETPNNG